MTYPMDELPAGVGIYEKGRQRWLKYHAENPNVWEAFKRFAGQAFEHRERYSPWSVGGRIRWDLDFEAKTDDGFKLSNNHIAYYSRAWMLEDPLGRGRFFRTRPMRGEDHASLLIALMVTRP